MAQIIDRRQLGVALERPYWMIPNGNKLQIECLDGSYNTLLNLLYTVRNDVDEAIRKVEEKAAKS